MALARWVLFFDARKSYGSVSSMSKRVTAIAAIVSAAILILAGSGCGMGSAVKVSSVDELDDAIHPKEAPKPVEKPVEKAAVKVVAGGGGGEPFALEKATATIKGVVLFEGTPPKVLGITVSDSGCAKCRAENTMHVLVKENYVINDGKFANVIVFVSDGSNKYNFENFTLPPARINQFGCQYIPHVLALMTDQKLEIQSSDDVNHNIHASPKDNKEFNVSQGTKGIMPTKPSFATPEMDIKVQCDVHNWMTAHICVFGHPFFALTKEDGTFEIKLPPGKYELSAWQENQGLIKAPKPQNVEVKADAPSEIKFVYMGK